MSGHTVGPAAQNSLASVPQLSTKATPKNLATINSKQGAVGPLSSLDNNKTTRRDDIGAQQILSNNMIHRIDRTEIDIIDSGVASSNNRNQIDLSETRNSTKAIDFSSSDKESPIGDSWRSTNKANHKPQSNQPSLHSTFHPLGTTSSNRPNQPSESQNRFESLLPQSSDFELAADPDDRAILRANSNSNSSRNLVSQNRTQNLYLCDSSNSDGNESRGHENNRLESQVLLDESPTPNSSGGNNYENDRHNNNNFDEDDEEVEFDRSVIDEQQQIDKSRRDHYDQSLDSHRAQSPSYFKRLQRSLFSRRLFLFNGLNNSFVSRILTDSTELDLRGGSGSEYPYTQYEDTKDLLTGTSKYNLGKRARKSSGSRTFRGSYKYSRTKISMAIMKKFFSLLVQRSTLALFGAFLIHVTLGTVYTLSNINSYLTSYMRKHGSPHATYGGSMWISSLYAVGQGFSMVLGGYLEKRFSARVACVLGCALHSVSIMSTSWAVDHGPWAVLLTYGFMPGFGCGLAYMTPMSNGFGWFPNRKGLVAGVILAGFGIGTFIFNMAQTAYVNPQNLSPLEDADGYFTQNSILDKVPHLFVFIGSIYAAMQFVGCCLLFKPPSSYPSSTGKGNLDERPILIETEMPLKRSIQRREFIVLFMVYGITTQGVLFVNSMIKEYGQIFIGNDMYLAWTGSMASIANSMGRLVWGLAIDRFSFTQCFTSITIIFGALMFIMPFEFVLSSKLLYLLCTLGIFGSFSGWMSTYPVHLSRVFGRTNSGMIYGLIFISQSLGGILTALGAHYLIDHYNRFVPFFCVVLLEIIGLFIYHLFYPK